MGQIINIGAGEGASTAVQTVATFAALPSPPAEGVGAERVTADTGVLYIWDGAAWNAAAGGGAVVSVNGQTGTVNLTTTDIPEGTNLYSTYANINTALGLPTNSFLFSNGSSEVVGFGNWSIDTAIQTSNVNVTIQPNNTSTFWSGHVWSVDVDPLQNSPDDSVLNTSLNVNLDSTATGFNFGSNGEASTILTGGHNYGGNGATIGRLRHLNFYTSLGNGTDPGTFKDFSGISDSYNVSANITLDGAVSGYGFNWNVNAGATTTSNFNVLWLSDFSQIPVNVYGYQGLVCQPTIATIKNNHNFNAVSAYPNITTMEGNAGYYPFSAGGVITTMGTGGYQAYQSNTNATTVPATANFGVLTNYSQIGTMAAGSTFTGVQIGPTITTLNGNYIGYETNPQIAGGAGDVSLYQGSLGSITTTSTNLYALNLNGITANGIQSSLSASGIRTNFSGTLVPLSGQTIQGQHTLFTEFDMTGVGAITGTDFLCNIFSPDVNFGAITDSIALGPIGLGVNMVAFAGQTHGHGSMDLLNAVTPTAIFQEDFTLVEWRNVNAYVVNAGYTGSTTKATAFYHEVGGAGLFATTHWGLRVVTPGIENYVESIAVGTASQKVSNASVAIELGGTTRAFVNLNVTTAEKNALTALPGMQVFDTTLNQLSYYNGTVWVNL